MVVQQVAQRLAQGRALWPLANRQQGGKGVRIVQRRLQGLPVRTRQTVQRGCRMSRINPAQPSLRNQVVSGVRLQRRQAGAFFAQARQNAHLAQQQEFKCAQNRRLGASPSTKACTASA